VRAMSPSTAQAATRKSIGRKKSPSSAPTPRRSPAVGRFVKTLQPWQAERVEQVRALMQTASPGSREGMSQGHPTYDLDGPFAFIDADARGSSVRFTFLRGARLKDSFRILHRDAPGDDDDSKANSENQAERFVELGPQGTFPENALVGLIQQAVVLNLSAEP